MNEDDSPNARPGLKVMPEYTVNVPVWHGPGSEDVGNVSADELRELGVSDSLLERLRGWQRSWDHDPFGKVEPSRAFWPGSPLTVRLARQLQAELPNHRIFLWTEAGVHPVEECAD